MKELLQLNNVSFHVKDHVLFQKVSTHVQEGDIIGLIGKNGAGKSTFLHMLNGDVSPTTGEIKPIVNALNIAMVEQETVAYVSGDMTKKEVTLLENWRVPNRPYTQLSGGEKVKARLAKGLALDADILMLDEPTNHLDDDSTAFLINQLKAYRGTVILVSHDRYFLDAVATKIWSLENGTLIDHKGNYTSYMKARKQKRESQQRQYDNQQKMVTRIEGQLKELTSWSQKAHAQSTKKEGYKEYYRLKAKRMDAQVKSKQKRLEKELEKINAAPVEQDDDVHFSMTANTKVGKRFLEVKQLTKSFDDHPLFKEASFTIQHGEKVALIGPNGSGKTTFLNILMGHETAQGDVWLSPSATIGYLTQDVFDLPLDQTPSHLFAQDTYKERGKVQNLMKHLGFTASQWAQPIRHMSMGERVKCKLMTYILEEKEVLVLDEPTNHLDLPSREQLEETLSHYNGTLLIVSHDRYFIEKTTNTRLVFSQQRIQKHLTDDKPSPERDTTADKRLALETERQDVLGKLSLTNPTSQDYAELDRKFNDLTRQLKELDS
ncbi:ABC-F type ribosomal protection protein [Salipaludibacillus agaradhaerens]|uniref:ribosomal protection-like ABC-F family protein n=1 Tax=Salipaludibacillus agaradhaerens TaxID=76935 RepID=UPI002150C1FD|nr:ABC-F type ribosomal protection protein [Salipaludibacillus agaradhaerens]MCR6105002.1 ABC-F type ribosomal protection protein [Salipaludibacillus agaradhaerens]MCR6117047.1 ABC-F type ribosomal protection protein [Salipaludibacillus agaradhaerens]